MKTFGDLNKDGDKIYKTIIFTITQGYTVSEQQKGDKNHTEFQYFETHLREKYCCGEIEEFTSVTDKNGCLKCKYIGKTRVYEFTFQPKMERDVHILKSPAGNLCIYATNKKRLIEETLKQINKKIEQLKYIFQEQEKELSNINKSLLEIYENEQ